MTEVKKAPATTTRRKGGFRFGRRSGRLEERANAVEQATDVVREQPQDDDDPRSDDGEDHRVLRHRLSGLASAAGKNAVEPARARHTRGIGAGSG